MDEKEIIQLDELKEFINKIDAVLLESIKDGTITPDELENNQDYLMKSFL